MVVHLKKRERVNTLKFVVLEESSLANPTYQVQKNNIVLRSSAAGIEVTSQKGFSMKQIEVFNLLGQNIKTLKAKNPHKVLVQGLQKGLYILKINNQRGRVITKKAVR